MKDSKFNAKKFLKDIKKSVKKIPRRQKEEAEDAARANTDEDLDSLNEEIREESEKKKKRSSNNKKAFFDKVGGFFDPEPQKERVLSKEDFRRAGDVYFASVSAFYKVIERILWVVLVLFLVFSLLTNYKEITFNNFFYLLKDFSSAVDTDTSNYQILSYDSDKRQKFSLFRGGIVSASPSSVSIFTTSGRRSLKNSNDYYSPNIVTCDKYVLVYDSASAAFSVYNSFSKVYNQKLDAPITDAAFAEDGSFAVATREADIKTVIYLYGKDIKQRGYISQSDYVFDMSLSARENRFATIAYDVGEGTGETVITFYDVANNTTAKKLYEYSLSGEFPLSCSYLESGELAVITDQSIRVFDKNFNDTGCERFYEASIGAFSATKEGAVAVVNAGTVRTVFAFNSSGELVYNKPIGENISRVEMVDKYIFLQTASGVIRIDTDKKTREYLSSSQGSMLVYSEDTAIVCGEAKAEYLVFE